MAVRYDPTAYLYASARIRAMENALVGKDAIGRLIELKSEAEILAAIAAQGFPTERREDGSADAEATLLAGLRAGFDTVREAIPDRGLTAFLQIPYDCNNIKAFLKCEIRGIDASGMMIDVGTVPAETLCRAMREGDLSLLPPEMAAAVPAAKEAFAKTKNPQEIDTLLDRACFADMAAAAAPLPFAAQYVARRADLLNLTICLRVLRMRRGELGLPLLLSALLPCGTLPESFIREAFEGGEARMAEMLELTPYAGLMRTEGKRTLAAVERNADDLLAEYARSARFVPFGAEVPVCYLLALETSVKNLRILLAGKAAGLDSDTIRGRIRESYV